MKTLAICFFFITAILNAQKQDMGSPIVHIDTTGFEWKGDMYKKSRHGIWVGTHPASGYSVRTNYANGKLEGSWEVYYRNGHLRERGQYRNNQRNGEWLSLIKTGDSLYVANYRMDTLHGSYKLYTTNNKLVQQGNFVSGRKEGKWNSWNYTDQGELFSHSVADYVSDTVQQVVITKAEGIYTQHYSHGQQVRTDYTAKEDPAYARNEFRKPPPPPKKVELAFSEQMPSFPGGDTAMEKFVNDSMRYPVKAIAARKQGTVYVYFEIGKDGTIGNIAVRKGVPGAPELDKEAVRIISIMPKWIPGRMNGRPVKVSMTVPIKFTLDD